MRKQTVLFVVNHLTIGGVQKSLISALNALDYEKNEVTLYLRRNRIVLLPYINKNVKVIVNKDKTHYYRKPYAILLQTEIKMCDLFRKESSLIKEKLNLYIHNQHQQYEKKHYFSDAKYDIAIAYNEGYTAEFVADCVVAKQKIMFFQSSTDSNHNLHTRIIPIFGKIVVEHSDIKNSIYSWYGDVSEKTTIIENYTDFSFLRAMSKEFDISVDSECVMLCTAARFSPEKGIDLAIEAARLLKNQGYSFVWYVLGDGPEMDKIKSLVNDYRLTDCVKLMGMQTNPYPYMAACDIYVQPSREEALSIAMLESQILCAPMVSTKTAGGLAMIQEGVNGLLADINTEALAERIELLMKDGELRNTFKNNLSAIDYSKEEERYKKDWEVLLE